MRADAGGTQSLCFAPAQITTQPAGIGCGDRDVCHPVVASSAPAVSSSPSPSASSLYSLALPLSVCSVSVHPSSGYSPHQRHLISYMEYDLRVTLVSQGALGRPCLPQPLRCTMPWVLGTRRVRQAGPWWLSCAEGSGGRKLQ